MGNEDLTRWLKQHARPATRQGARTYLMVDQDASVAGYFALAPHVLERDNAPGRIDRGGPRQIPAILLAKAARDRIRQGEGLGAELLVRALEHTVEAAGIAGGKLNVVDAVDDIAVRFYGLHDFEAIPDNARRLVKKLSTVAASLGLPWP